MRKLLVLSLSIHLAAAAGLWIWSSWHIEALALPALPSKSYPTDLPKHSAEEVPESKAKSSGSEGSGNQAGGAAPAFDGPDTDWVDPGLSTMTGTGIGTADTPGGSCPSGEICSVEPTITNVGGMLEIRELDESSLAARFKSGQTQILPGSTVRSQVNQTQSRTLVAKFHICIDEQGDVFKLGLTASTGFDSYDRKLMAAISKWKYHPYRQNGVPVAACAPLHIVYQLHRL